MSIGEPERTTQRRVIDFFQERLGYTYLGNLKDRQNSNVIEDRLRQHLRSKGYSEKLIDGAIAQLDKKAHRYNRAQGIYHANEGVYSLLKYGAKVQESPETPPVTVRFIDWDSPVLGNDFAIAEEVTVIEGDVNKRPDLVVYVNGIAVAVIELKRSSVGVVNGIRQNLTNQKDSFIQPFFSTMQLCMAGNESEGLRYGTLLTPERFYMEWKDDGFARNKGERSPQDRLVSATCQEIGNKLLRQVYAMFYKVRFLDFIGNFVAFDKGVKKVCRYNQYFAIKRAQTRLNNLIGWINDPERDPDEPMGGVIWHTQGSGKTLTMVWLARWILSQWNMPNQRVLIVTDREELDEQIEKTFGGMDEKVVRTSSGRDLLTRLNSLDDRLLCSLVHKFGHHDSEASTEDYDRYIKDLKDSLPKGFKAKGSFVVFVDECHRTQSGKLHAAMKALIPNAVFIGFTGTPLLAKDKKTRSSQQVFGSYIHTYKYNEAVHDGVVLDLLYEYRDIPQELSSPERVDRWFEAKAQGLSDRAKARLRQKWGTMQKVYASKPRLEKIAWDILQDFETRPRLMNGAGNAMLVADSIFSACRYYEIFQTFGFRKCAVISSYAPSRGDLRTDTVSDDEDTDTFLKYQSYLKMVGLDPDNLLDNAHVAAKVKAFEKEAKRKFVDEPANMKLLIVVDKLLTGFDAPKCTYLYIDKSMQDHGLFQAICRVNRLDDDTKQYGYIVDYKGLFKQLTDAMTDYTTGAFSGYDPEDVKDVIKDARTETVKRFKDVLQQLKDLCADVPEPRDDAEYIRSFCGEPGQSEASDEQFAKNRSVLYSYTNELMRRYAAAKPYLAEDEPDMVPEYEKDVTFYMELKNTIANASGDFIDFKAYERDMRLLLDNFLNAGEAVKSGESDDLSLLGVIEREAHEITEEDGNGKKNDEAIRKKREAAAETMEHNAQVHITNRRSINPRYYAKMSQILYDLIEKRKKHAIGYAELLEEYKQLAKNVEHPEESDHYPESIRSSSPLRAIYDAVGEDEQLALRIYHAVENQKMEGWRDNPVIVKRIKKTLDEQLHDDDKVEELYTILENQDPEEF